MGDICVKHNVLIVSDEIHSDFVYADYHHHVFAALKSEYLERTVTCTAPSKTFNLAGLQISNIFIPNPDIRKKFQKEVTKTGYSQLNAAGLIACQAAYEGGGLWLGKLKQYLADNLDFVRSFLNERLPEIKLVEPQGTYLLWLDFRSFGFSADGLEDLIVNRAKLWLDCGSLFGTEGEGFERVNIACPRATLNAALLRLERAVNESACRCRKRA